jgi:protein-S-isoprenylcysteine O-methyltransferase Ste14
MIGVLLVGPWGGGRWGGNWSWFAGIPLVLLGAWAGLRGKSDLGSQRITHPEPVSGGRLVTTGIYSRLRHPLYASLILLGFGWAVLWNSLPALALAMVQGAFLDAKARCEERHLQKRFADYDAYARRVKRWIPGVF